MKRSEFVADPPGTIDELVEFAEEYELHLAEDLFPQSDLDSKVFEDIRDLESSQYWYTVRDKLYDINCFAMAWASIREMSSGTFCPFVTYESGHLVLTFIFSTTPAESVSSNLVNIIL